MIFRLRCKGGSWARFTMHAKKKDLCEEKMKYLFYVLLHCINKYVEQIFLFTYLFQNQNTYTLFLLLTFQSLFKGFYAYSISVLYLHFLFSYNGVLKSHSGIQIERKLSVCPSCKMYFLEIIMLYLFI